MFSSTCDLSGIKIIVKKVETTASTIMTKVWNSIDG
jgi:hypothetical protein